MKSYDHPAVRKYARSFSASGGAELDEMLGEARLAYARALRAIDAGQYDPRLASFDTYATRVVYNQLRGAHNRRKCEIPTVPIDDGNQWNLTESTADESTPAPDRRLLFAELVRALPDDALAVVWLVLDDALPGDLVDQVLSGAKGAREKLIRYIRRELGFWRGDRAHEAFSAVTDMLTALATT